MKPSETITKQANDLIRYYSTGWFCKEIGMNFRTMKRRLNDHKWTVNEAAVINRYHEMIVEKISKV